MLLELKAWVPNVSNSLSELSLSFYVSFQTALHCSSGFSCSTHGGVSAHLKMVVLSIYCLALPKAGDLHISCNLPQYWYFLWVLGLSVCDLLRATPFVLVHFFISHSLFFFSYTLCSLQFILLTTYTDSFYLSCQFFDDLVICLLISFHCKSAHPLFSTLILFSTRLTVL